MTFVSSIKSKEKLDGPTDHGLINLTVNDEESPKPTKQAPPQFLSRMQLPLPNQQLAKPHFVDSANSHLELGQTFNNYNNAP